MEYEKYPEANIWINNPLSELHTFSQYIEIENEYHEGTVIDIEKMFFLSYPGIDIRTQFAKYKAMICMDAIIYENLIQMQHRLNVPFQYDPYEDKPERKWVANLAKVMEHDEFVIPEPPDGLNIPQKTKMLNPKKEYYIARSLWDLAHILSKEAWEPGAYRLSLVCELLPNQNNFSNLSNQNYYEFAPVATGEILVSKNVYYVQDIKKWIYVKRTYISY